ncbi:hypothetical protein L2E82_22915 [Cichorium intybus]|uniref:Uncharacterized protein n=1 Tax=Cichorium intybus TaxID=13427 RepID=A0ACB9DYK5_CICIN|nr:hypothetical protein L2E82_22915 [Cichorium intybus]
MTIFLLLCVIVSSSLPAPGSTDTIEMGFASLGDDFERRNTSIDTWVVAMMKLSNRPTFLRQSWYFLPAGSHLYSVTHTRLRDHKP